MLLAPVDSTARRAAPQERQRADPLELLLSPAKKREERCASGKGYNINGWSLAEEVRVDGEKNAAHRGKSTDLKSTSNNFVYLCYPEEYDQ